MPGRNKYISNRIILEEDAIGDHLQKYSKILSFS